MNELVRKLAEVVLHVARRELEAGRAAEAWELLLQLADAVAERGVRG